MRSILPTFFLVLVGTTGPAHADTITVCARGCDHTSINAAIASAIDGDVIQLSAETYTEGSAIDTLGKSVTLRGVADDAGRPLSILDGGRTHRVIQCRSGESGETSLMHLLVRNGRDTNGAGMLNVGSNPTITDCIFVDNRCVARGGGMYNRKSSSPSLVRTRFIRNRASSGGGIYNFDASSPTLVDCTLEGNIAPTIGGGMANWNQCSPILTGCSFLENRSDESPGGGGGAMYNYAGSSPRLDACSFERNSATNGAGIQAIGGEMTLVGCLFRGNTADICGGILILGTKTTATRCSFLDNSSEQSGAAMTITGSEVLLDECRFRGNTRVAVTIDEESALQISNDPTVPGDLDLDGDFDEADARLAMSMFGIEAASPEETGSTLEDR